MIINHSCVPHTIAPCTDMITYRLGSARMVDAHVCVDHTEAADNGSNKLRHHVRARKQWYEGLPVQDAAVIDAVL